MHQKIENEKRISNSKIIMVWKKVKQPTKEEIEHESKRAIKVKANPLFSNAHTREEKELNQEKECKITVEKKVK